MVAGSHARKLLHRPFSTIFLRYVFLKVSRPRCRGCLISVFQTRGGERWPGTAGVGDAAPVPAQPRMIPACRSRTPRPLTAGRPVVQSACPPVECPGFNGGESRTGSSGLRDERPTTGGRCGASLKHRARDALGLADLRHQQTLRQASMSRGVEARGSFWTPGVLRAVGWGRAARNKNDGPARGLNKEYGRWRLGLPDSLASLLEAAGGAYRQHL